ncbi:hypothetical protein NL108_002567 [Boleophthalmus pectinirostris]|uniref:OX-2 membrane glycoprotein-like n=1 Tax=Boleophthalmus pectinirostris TaxID=150288 RepID=UPI000A1C6425|nr:OX-2 membrane glycoprotein-like [Boleophthalmus pectinirostris]KAJ0062231.1 hypothetical protein NL108_002567 [Boleophthalmus pectinirostris]
MCTPTWPLCLLLCLLVLAVSRTSGVVTAPSALTITVGQPLNLSCSITLTPNNKVRQIRWLNKDKHTLLAYTPVSPPTVSVQDPSVHLILSHPEFSTIAIKEVKPEDEGCYVCIFDVYPGGRQQGKTCVSVTGTVEHKSNTTAIAGKPTNLSCSYTLPSRVLQVVWKKRGQKRTVIASYSKQGHFSIAEMFLNRISLDKTLGDSQLSIQEVKLEDEACYTCEFHTYPDGTKSAMTCLTIYVLPTQEMNYVTLPSGDIKANCSVQSKPLAQIEWDFGGFNRTLGAPMYYSYNHSDGTTTETSTVLLKSEALSDVKCIIHHPGLEKPLVVSLPNSMDSLIVLLAVCGVVVVLLICLCVCLCKCFFCNDD